MDISNHISSVKNKSVMTLVFADALVFRPRSSAPQRGVFTPPGVGTKPFGNKEGGGQAPLCLVMFPSFKMSSSTYWGSSDFSGKVVSWMFFTPHDLPSAHCPLFHL